MKFAPIIKRFPHFLHGGDYNPDQWQATPEVIDEDFRLMGLAGCNTFSLGIFAWSSYEVEDGVFEFGWLDDIMDRLAARGLNAVLATPSGAMPPWLAEAHPEIRRVGRDGQRVPYGHRHNHCWTSPVYRAKVERINRALAERYRAHPALAAWHVSNEYNGECFCELCVTAFHQWLERRYGSLDKLNAAWWSDFWGHKFTAFSQINPRDNCLDSLALDWKRFTTWQCRDFMLHELKPIRELTPDVPATTNMMGYFDGLDYWRVAEVCDFIADDCYPTWDEAADYPAEAARYAMLHDMHRSMKDGKPFLMMESAPGQLNWKPFFRMKRPGVHQLEMMLAMGHGADGTMYFQWRKGRGAHEKFHAAVVDHVGHERTRMFQEVAMVGAAQAKLDAVVGSAVPVEAAVVHDWEVRWALETCGGPANASKKTTDTLQAHHRALFNLNLPVDVIESSRDFSQYKLLVAPMLFMLKPGVAERLRRFVADGGTLVFTYLGGYVDETNLCFTGGWPGDGLRELFGIWNEDLDGFPPSDVQTLRLVPGNELGLTGEHAVREYAALIHLEGARALATFGHQFYAGAPALTVNSFGKGEAYYLAARTTDEFHLAFYRKLVEALELKTALPLGAPSGVHGSLRSDGGQDFLFLQNFNDHETTVKLGPGKRRDLLTGQEIEGELTLAPLASQVLETR